MASPPCCYTHNLLTPAKTFARQLDCTIVHVVSMLDVCLADCRLRQVGLPVFQKYTYTYWGAWMKDPLPDPAVGDKFWLTKHFYGKLLFRYDSLDKFRNNESGSVLELQDFYFGTGWNLHFFYLRAGLNLHFFLLRDRFESTFFLLRDRLESAFSQTLRFRFKLCNS